MTPRQKVELLLGNFKQAQQVIPTRELRTASWFDIEKINEIFDEAGEKYTKWPFVSIDDIAEEIREIVPSFSPEFPKPKDTKHYIFRAKPPTLHPFKAIRLRDVYVSWDASSADKRSYYVFDKDKRLINGLFFGADPFLEPVKNTYSAPICFAEDVFMRFNIAHLIFDKFPRAHIAQDLFGISNSAIFFSNGYTDFISSLSGLNMFGLANDEPRGTFFAKDLIVFSNSFLPTAHPLYNNAPPHVRAIKELRQSALEKYGDSTEQIKFFLTRAADLPRGIVNMNEISPLLTSHGFEIGDAAAMEPADQIRLFLRTSALGGAHGAGLTNLVFQSEGSQVIELLPPIKASMSYWKSATALGHDYRVVTCHDPEFGDIADHQDTRHRGRNNRRQLYVPLDRLDAVLSD